jgi:transcriptional antiterminator RfaH
VAYTKPRQEHVASSQLEQQQFDVYLPLFKTIKKPAKRPSVAEQGPDARITSERIDVVAFDPMFPRYIFFRPNSPRQSVAAAKSTRGVNSVVMFGAGIAEVQPEVVQAIQVLEQLRNDTPLEAISPIQAGRRVRLRDSALNGVEGLVESVSSKRVTVLLEILGRQKTLRLEHGQVELI